MRKIFAVAQNTFREAIRDRILYGFLFFAVSLILFSLVIGRLSFNEEVRVCIDIGMAGISLFSVLMAIFLGITLLHKEIEKRTLYTILSRPVSRASYLLGKFLGLSAVLLVQICLMTAVWIAVLKIQGASVPPGIFAASALIFFETMLVISAALFFTSFSSPFLSGLFTFGLFAAGRGADLIAQLANKDSMSASAPLLKAAGKIIPNFYLFYPSGKMVEGSWATVHAQFVSSGYLASTVAYAVAYTTVFLAAAVLLLYRRDLI
jgi:ABC-type transport system involved in multi-copper enzyme maturation permease subunit